MFPCINTNIGHHLAMFQARTLSTLLGFDSCFRKKDAIHLRFLLLSSEKRCHPSQFQIEHGFLY
ncbi:hypothetical protein C5167_036721 [Papaver somniferum]|uniref:Uncharacterized protein n=1 Tax=Papaver somniferum TaxID=3469 RepID=A0A4Y7I4H5_PAPSO|nr:hypothetical protein C5167_036721 [Papaver somniferum]